MQRTELQTALKRVEPALATKDILPVLQSFYFDGDGTVTAYDDLIAVSTPCEFEFGQGCVNGRMLLDWIAASRAKDVSVLEGSDEDEHVRFKAGRSVLKTSVLPADEYPFEWPDQSSKGVVTLPITDEFVTALSKAAISLGTDPGHAWRMGATVVVNSKGTTIYTSDNFSISRARTKGKSKKKIAVNLAPRFVEMLLAFAKKEKPDTLYLSDDGWSEVTFESGTRLWSKTGLEVDDGQFRGAFAQTIDVDDEEIVTVPTPKGFDGCLDRALVALSQSSEKTTKASVLKTGKLRLETEAPGANVRDILAKFNEHPEVSVVFDPALVKRALPVTKRFGIVADVCVYLSEDGFDHVVTLVA